jgi:hypothetical protein
MRPTCKYTYFELNYITPSTPKAILDSQNNQIESHEEDYIVRYTQFEFVITSYRCYVVARNAYQQYESGNIFN